MDFKQVYEKYKDTIPYLFFGLCTTAVNVITYWLFAHVLKLTVMFSAVMAWVLAVLFAYLTNRKWVFHSEARSRGEIIRELFAFFGCRVATGVLDWACMFILVTKLGFNDILIKIIANIAVIVLNYLASKFLIFRKKLK